MSRYPPPGPYQRGYDYPAGGPSSWPGRQPAPPSQQQVMARRNELTGTGYYEQSQGGSDPQSGNQDYFRNAPAPQPGGNGALFAALYEQYKLADQQAHQAADAYKNYVKALPKVSRKDAERNPLVYARDPANGKYQLRSAHAEAYKYAKTAAQLFQQAIHLREQMKAAYPGYDSQRGWEGHSTRIQILTGKYNKMVGVYSKHGNLT